jgi:hypothetical protein
MWQTKYFKSLKAQTAWIKKNNYRYQIAVLFVNNGHAVEYRPIQYR